LLEEGKINLQEKKRAIILPAPKMRSNMDTKQVAQRSSLEALQRVEKEKKEAIILPAPKMRSNMDTKQVAQRSSLEALQRRSPVRIHAHKSQY
jgi:DNA/RNA-binding domain of Phe-tRNA-synthetase-like protein